jgi:hypothetical protein
MNAVSQLEATFLPLLRSEKQAAASAFPQFRFNTGSSSIGTLTSHQGHNVWLECTFPNATDTEAESVAIVVGIKHIASKPSLCEASVEWGNGQPSELSLELLPQPVEITDRALLQLAARFHELIQAFRLAIQSRVVRRADA